MSLLLLAPVIGATSSTVVGGTPVALKGLQSDFTKLHCRIDDDAAQDQRTLVKFSATEPKASVTNPSGFTQGRTQTQVLFPQVLSSGEVEYCTININVNMSVEATPVQIAERLITAAHIMTDSASRDFYVDRSVL